MFEIIVLTVLCVVACVALGVSEIKRDDLKKELAQADRDYQGLWETNSNYVQHAVNLQSRLYSQEAAGAHARNELRESLEQMEAVTKIDISELTHKLAKAKQRISLLEAEITTILNANA
ncbi:MAG: hypothetical protein IMZ61_14705 [Planctomycetes bacterium]|nr:hypothetical protein [Planctomycetota bacterium]